MAELTSQCGCVRTERLAFGPLTPWQFDVAMTPRWVLANRIVSALAPWIARVRHIYCERHRALGLR